MYTVENTTHLMRRLSWLAIATLVITSLTSIGFDVLQSRAEHAMAATRLRLLLSLEATALASDREAAVRGFLLSHGEASLSSEARTRERLPVALHALEVVSAADPAVLAQVSSVRSALENWENGFAGFAIRNGVAPSGDSLSGARLFDPVRAAFDSLNSSLESQHDDMTAYTYRLQFISTSTVLIELVAFASAILFVVRKRLRHQAQETVRLAAFLENALESSPIGFAFLDTDLRFIRVNSFLADAIGVDAEAFTGRRVTDVLTENLPVIQSALKTTLTTRKPVRNLQLVRAATRRADEAHFNASFYPIETTEKLLLGAGAVVADITEAVLKARGLAESEERYRLVSRATSDAVFDWNLETGAVVWNEGVTEIFGYARGEIVEHISWWSAHTHLADSERIMNSFLETMNGGGSVWKSDEYRFCKRDGTYSNVVSSARIMRREDGTAYRAIGAISDRTREHSLAKQLRQSQKMEAIGRLAGGIAHDFNNILTVIRISTEFILADLPESHTSRADVEEVRKAGDRAAKLTRQLLAFSRNQVLAFQLLNLSEVVSGITGMLRRIIPENIALKTELDAEVATVKADPGQMEQVLLNLAINAADAMEKGGTLTISAVDREVVPLDGETIAGRYVCLSVSDTGTGMDSETISKIFDPFFTTKAIGKGTGLGLATVQGIIAQSNGIIRVRSEIGLGTTFEVLLPAVEGKALAPAGETKAVAPPLALRTILLVEDENPIRIAIRKVLEREGLRVIEAENGAVALDVATEYEGPIDLLLTDSIMPEMGGTELASKLAEVHPEAAVLVMSGYVEGILAADRSERAVRFIEKPFTSADLLAAIRGALSS